MTDNRRIFRYMTKQILVEVNAAALREGRNCALLSQFVADLPETDLFPIVAETLHNDVEMRVMFQYGEGLREYVDMSFERFDALPKFEYDPDAPDGARIRFLVEGADQ